MYSFHPTTVGIPMCGRERTSKGLKQFPTATDLENFAMRCFHPIKCIAYDMPGYGLRVVNAVTDSKELRVNNIPD